MENKIFEEKQPQQPQGWKDVAITPDMPLTALVQFFNVLNQRICAIEDSTFIEMPTGGKLSLTDLYRIQAEQELKQQQEKAQQEQSKGE